MEDRFIKIDLGSRSILLDTSVVTFVEYKEDVPCVSSKTPKGQFEIRDVIVIWTNQNVEDDERKIIIRENPKAKHPLYYLYNEICSALGFTGPSVTYKIEKEEGE